MRILVLTFYFEPDLCAGSFRATPFVRALSEALGDGGEIEVVTTFPNRYHSYAKEAAESEEVGNVRVRRIRLPLHKSGFVDQAKAFLFFARSVWKAVRGREYDVVFATSSRLFTAALGAVIAKRKGAKLYLDIRDIFSETIRDVLPRRLGKPMFPLFSLIERFTVQSADHVNLVSEGFRDYFSRRYPARKYSFITNGIDDDFLGTDFRKATPTGKKIVLYAGNIGESQGLERVIPEGARRMGADFEFWIIGDGGRRQRLVEEIERQGADNVRLFAPVSRSELIDFYRQADYLFLHLNDYDAFKRVLPSKIFEYAATGKAVLAGVGGYARHFVEKNVTNAEVFKPCDVDGFCEKLSQLTPGDHVRPEFIERFTRKKLMAGLARDVLALGPVKSDIAGLEAVERK